MTDPGGLKEVETPWNGTTAGIRTIRPADKAGILESVSPPAPLQDCRRRRRHPERELDFSTGERIVRKRHRIYGIPASRARKAAFVSLAALTAAAGCSQQMPDRAERMTRGYVYYFDGAGGGGVVNWVGGVRQGLLDAGYGGAGEVFKWNTGLGVVSDQEAGVEYKRSRAAEAARSIRRYASDHPGAPVTLIGLSAGTSVAVFTLEALPAGSPVESVILLGASISDDYDLTRALQRVRNRMYVFTSERDAVLAFAVTIAGTADRRTDTLSAGLRGFRMPPRPSAETRAQYARLVHIRWKPEFALAGNVGGHTDAVKASFVQEYIAPLIMAGMARRAARPDVAPAGLIRNPDYDRWASFDPGAWTMFEGEQVVEGVRQPLRMKARLVSRHEDRLLVERCYEITEADGSRTSRVQQFLVQARIDPAEHPLTCPSARISESEPENLAVAGRTLTARVRMVEARGEFPEYGRDVRARLAMNDAVPGGMIEVHLKSGKNGRPYEVRGRVVAFGSGQ